MLPEPALTDLSPPPSEQLPPVDQEGGDFPSKDEIQQYFTECLTSSMYLAHDHILSYRLNEHLINGHQNHRLNTKNDQFVEDTMYKTNEVPYLPVNLVQNALETWTTLLVQDEPSMYAVAPGNSVKHRWAANVVNALIEYWRDHLDTASKTARLVYLGGLGDISAFYTRMNPKTKEPVLDVVCAKDVFFDHQATDENKSRYYIVRTWEDEDTAQALLDSVGSNATPKTETYRDGHDQPREGVEIFHFWHKPTIKYPSGFFATFVGRTELIELTPYPLIFTSPERPHPEVRNPLHFFKARYVYGSCYGRTMITDALPIQRRINEINGRKIKLLEIHSNQIRTLPESLIDADLNDDGDLYINNQLDKELFGYVAPPPIPPIITDFYDDLLERLYETLGVSQTTVGQEQPASKSALAMEHETRLDQLKNATAVKSLKQAIQGMWITVLKLYQKYQSDQTTISIVDDDTMTFLPINFRGIDLEGVGLRFEPQSELEGRQAAKISDAQQRLQAGLISPTKADQLGGSLSSAVAAQVSNTAIDQFLKTNQLEITRETVDPELFLSTLEDRIEQAMVSRDRQTTEKLFYLKQQYILQVAGSTPQAPSAAPELTTPQGQEPAQTPVLSRNQKLASNPLQNGSMRPV